MTAYLIRRLWQMIPTLFGVVLLVFFLFKAFGNDPAEIGLGAVAEAGLGAGDLDAEAAGGAEEAVPAEGAEGDDHAAAVEQLQLAL